MIDHTTFGTLRAHYHTFGCKLNFSETSSIQKLLEERGITRCPRGETPDLVVVNTCTVTETADRKCRQAIRSYAKRWPQAHIVVTGCYAQLKAEEAAALPRVAVVAGNDRKDRLAAYIDDFLRDHSPELHVTPSSNDMRSFTPSCSRGDRTRWFLKVQDGCDYFCTYCTIPYARGLSRSGKIADITAIAAEAASEGAKEIVITGVNIGDFGRDSGERLIDLLKVLDAVEGVERYRISSIEPNLLSEEMIRWIAEESQKFMPHFHIPLQSGSDAVLRLMNRRYDTALFASRIDMIRRLIPNAFIGVDVIAGARGETDEEWERSYSFIRSLPVTRLHVFPYSERPGTKALAIGHNVDPRERHLRAGRLSALSDEKHAAFVNGHIGEAARVLWEHPGRPGAPMHGFTENYIKIEAPFDPEYINRVTGITITPENLSKEQ